MRFSVEEQVTAPYPQWPPEVRKMQAMLGVEHEAEEDAQWISGQLSEQHRDFHAHHINFLPLATKDKRGRVWASLLAGAEGLPGFIQAPSSHQLQVKAATWAGEPATRNLVHGQAGQLVAGVGVELWSRRRNKLAGHAEALWSGSNLQLNVKIDEALGNCPKYIALRDLEAHTSTHPIVEVEQLEMSSADVLPAAVLGFITKADTIFLATSYLPSPNTSTSFPAHLGCNHRGGRPGWVRTRADHRTLVLQDYSGNRHLTSLGNVLADPHVGVVIPDFETGDVLYLTGEGKNLVDEAAHEVMPRAKVITLVKVTGYTLVRDALPFRQPPSANVPSPYSPPVRFLAEEQSIASVHDVKATLKSVDFHTEDLATFTFETSSPAEVIAGHYAVLDTTSLIGQSTYSHMAVRGQEATLNDDGIRTWTISSPPSSSSPTTFSLTIRKLPTGRVTPRFFSFGNYMMRQLTANDGSFIPKLELPLLGVGGSFVLPSTPGRVLLIAGGIGITPFLAHLQAIASAPKGEDDSAWEVQLLVSTREPHVTLDLLKRSLSASPSPSSNLNLDLTVHLFSPSALTLGLDFPTPLGVNVHLSSHVGRITPEAIAQAVKQGEGKSKVYLCGPPEFERSVQRGLRAAGVEEKEVETENFNY